MFNHGAFNRMPFNRAAQAGDDWFDTVDMAARINAAILTGGNLYDYVDMPAQCDALLSGGAGIQQVADLAAVIATAVQIHMDFSAASEMDAELSASALACIDLHPPTDMTADIGAYPRAGANAHISDDMAGLVFGIAIPSRDYRAPAVSMAAFFASQVTTIRFDVLTATFEVTVLPGSTLVIDSNGYVVLLDGEDVIWTHEGDWLHLSRSTYDVTFDFVGGTDVDKQILYTERWL